MDILAFFKGRHPKSRKMVRSHYLKQSAAPQLEQLEDRLAPATDFWIGGQSNLWSNPLNWSNGVPGNNTIAEFSNRSMQGVVLDPPNGATVAALNVDPTYGFDINLNQKNLVVTSTVVLSAPG